MEFAKGLDGTLYRRRGRDRGGLDCAGVLVFTARSLGLSQFDYVGYSDKPNPAEFQRALLSAGCRQLRLDQLEPGDIMMLAAPLWPVHCAIALPGNRMVHAWLPHKKVEIVPVKTYKYRGAYRFPGDVQHG